MRVCIFGTGYVGCITGVCLARLGFDIECIDIDKETIKKLSCGECHIFEPELQEIMTEVIKLGKITFSCSPPSGQCKYDAIIIAVGTPATLNGSTNLEYLNNVVDILTTLTIDNVAPVVIIKSTVPVGTTSKVNSKLCAYGYCTIFSPEFLREGSAITDFYYPDRLIFGSIDGWLPQCIYSLFDFAFSANTPILSTTYESAEMIKYASNAFLATKVAFINEIADLCEKVGGDVSVVSKGMGLDYRIGPEFLKAGPGYGGSCFPKDALALTCTALNANVKLTIVDSVILSNKTRKCKIISRLYDLLCSIDADYVSILGLSFKKNTDDVRESIAIDMVSSLSDAGIHISAHDPQACHSMAKLFPDISNINYFSGSPILAINNTQMCIIVTDWDCYAEIDWGKIKPKDGRFIIFDLRNILNETKIESLGFEYHCVGK